MNATPRPWMYTPPHRGKHGKKWRGSIGTKDASAQVCWINNPDDAALILRAVNNFEAAKTALARIAEGSGAYNINPLQRGILTFTQMERVMTMKMLYKIIRDPAGQYFVVSADGTYSKCWRGDFRSAKLDQAEKAAAIEAENCANCLEETKALAKAVLARMQEGG